MLHETALLTARDRDASVEARLAGARAFDVEARAHQAAPLPPEFAALERAGFAPGPLCAALADAERAGVEPFDALLCSGCFSETELVGALARAIGVDVAGADDALGAPVDADALALSAANGHLASLDASGEPRFVVAARGAAMRRLARARRGQPRTRSIALAGPGVFANLLASRAGSALAARASEGPQHVAPEMTVAHGLPRLGRRTKCAIAAGGGALMLAAFLWPTLGAALLAALGLVFAAMNGFRLFLCFGGGDARIDPRIARASLPIYTVLVALHREAAVIPSLLAALENLDYPAAKLDIKILLEAGDVETLAALAARPPRAGIEVLVLPPGGPKTKPRALNAGLLCARGEFLAVFDAEDRPDPKQLRVAVEAFRRESRDVACLQARLAIDNHADGWLCRHFAIEYAALFDVVLPALSALRLPIPLGGTSNHFRVSALRRIGGWDAANVTEDADLGLRLARFGYATRTIPSVTWEEAPTTLRPWIRQRTRWMKGFMVTTAVHSRQPFGLLAELGALRFLAVQLTIPGVALTALAYPALAAMFLFDGLTGALLSPAETYLEGVLLGFHVVNMIIGFSAGLACGWMGVDRRCPQRLWTTLFTLPIYWFLVGCAAWRAAWQIATARTSDWEKTAHGVSRRRATPPQA